ncbi:MAG: glycoside hydrolase family 16 protein [Fibrobacterales bacterium]
MTHIRLLLLASITSVFLVGCLGTDPADSSSGNGTSSEEVLSSEESPESSVTVDMDSSEDESSDVGISEPESSEVSSSSIVVESSSENVSSEEVSSAAMSSNESSSETVVSSSSKKEFTAPATKGEFTLVYEDEFETLDLDFWEKSDGSWKDNKCRFVDHGVETSDGVLKLIMTKEHTENDLLWAQRTLKNPDGEYQDPFYDGDLAYKDWASGELRSLKTYKYGRFETTIKAPNEGHYLSTFFLFNLPRDKQWLEIDFELMSAVPGQPTSNLLIDMGGGAWEWGQIEHKDLIFSHPDHPIDHQEKNVFAIEWTDSYIAWFVNETEIRRIDDASLIPQEPLHAVFNFWISEATSLSGENPDNYLDGKTAVTEYEYYRYYKWNGEDDFEHPAWCGNKTWNGIHCE